MVIAMWMMRAIMVASVSAALHGCGGLLVLDEDMLGTVRCERGCPALSVCQGDVCVDTSPCTLETNATSTTAVPLYCPDGLVCRDGLCLDPEHVDYCDCLAIDACVNGSCVTITDENRCSETVPEGLCPDGATCRDGSCLRPADPDACTATNPAGYCPPGFSCLRGYCTPLAVDPCTPDTGMGLCAWGFACRDPGPTCVAVTEECSEEHPQGSCEPGEICTRGQCACIACNPLNLNGCCPVNEFCSNAGNCIPDDTCAVNQDCDQGLRCSCPSYAPQVCDESWQCATCSWVDTCRCDEDCKAGEHCDADSGQCKHNEVCTTDDQCGPEMCCDTTLRCRACGTCAESADCRGTDEYCCATGECRPPDGCCVQQECAEGTMCLDGACLGAGDCRIDAHCAPGFQCAEKRCVPAPDKVCTAGNVTGALRTQCSLEDRANPSCCPIGESCCDLPEHCSVSNPYPPDNTHVCLAATRCLADGDCPTPGFTCNLATFTCEGTTPCDGNCPVGERCAAGLGCLSESLCLRSTDCQPGEVCNEAFVCERAAGCGDQSFDATRVKPNVLIVLDRSGSTQICQGREIQDGGGCCGGAGDDLACGLCAQGSPTSCLACTPEVTPNCGLATRWEHAKSAIDSITNAYSDVIRFGLTTYPRQWCGGSACDIHCNYCSCDLDYCTDGAGTCVSDKAAAAECHPNYEAGVANVPVADDKRTDIMNFLNTTYPGGGTPTGPTLRRLVAAPADAGIASADRNSYIVLVTDGAANGDVDAIAGCRNTDYTCKVDKALDSLRNLPRAVTSYVVGFAFEGVSAPLNCYADHGAQAKCALPLTCANLKEEGLCVAKGCQWNGASCSAKACTAYSTNTACSAAGCTWLTGACTGSATCQQTTATCYYEANNAASLVTELGTIIGEVSSCSFALSSVPEDPSLLYVYFQHDGIEERVTRDETAQEGWELDSAAPPKGQVVFHGDACERIKSGNVTPLVVYGCIVNG